MCGAWGVGIYYAWKDQRLYLCYYYRIQESGPGEAYPEDAQEGLGRDEHHSCVQGRHQVQPEEGRRASIYIMSYFRFLILS